MAIGSVIAHSNESQNDLGRVDARRKSKGGSMARVIRIDKAVPELRYSVIQEIGADEAKAEADRLNKTFASLASYEVEA